MRRLTATALLLLAIAATFVPIARALAPSSAPSPHACCLRKSAHPCHGSVSESEELVLRDAGCCNHECCHAVTSSQRVYAHLIALSLPVLDVGAFAAESHTANPNVQSTAFYSTRAPPAS